MQPSTTTDGIAFTDKWTSSGTLEFPVNGKTYSVKLDSGMMADEIVERAMSVVKADAAKNENATE